MQQFPLTAQWCCRLRRRHAVVQACDIVQVRAASLLTWQGRRSPVLSPTFKSKGCVSTATKSLGQLEWAAGGLKRAPGSPWATSFADNPCRHYIRAGTASSQTLFFEAASNVNISILFCGTCNLQTLLSFGMRMYGCECMVRKWPIWQLSKPWLWMEIDCTVCIEAWDGKGEGLKVHQGSASVVEQTDINVWDVCSTVEIWTSLYSVCCNPTRAYVYPLMGRNFELSSLKPLFCLISFCLLWSWYLPEAGVSWVYHGRTTSLKKKKLKLWYVFSQFYILG